MSEKNTIHPPAELVPPYWRGVSFLAGEVGDFLYGTYGRSTNTMVATGTEVSKRSGYMRAFDELFEGSAKSIHHRESGFNYTVASDGEGVKILSALTPRIGGGDRFSHIAYPTDSFDRADSATLSDDTSQNFWLEGETGHSGSSGGHNNCAIVSNQLKIADTEQGSAEFDTSLPSPFYVWRMEVDLASIDPNIAGEDGATQLWLFHSLPNEYKVGANVRNQKWSVEEMVEPSGFTNGHTTGSAWAGYWAHIFFEKSGSDVYRVRIRLYVQLSSRPMNQEGARLGKSFLIDSGVYDFANLAAFQQVHYIEIGREMGNYGKINHKINFYEGAGQESAAWSSPALSKSKAIKLNSKPDSQYHFTMRATDGDYGHCGLYLSSLVNNGAIFLDKFTVVSSFIT